MRPFVRTIETLELDGGWLCLNFINTVRNRFEEPVFCYLPRHDEVLKWAKRLELFSQVEIRRVKTYIEEHPDVAEKQHKKIIEVRETLYRMFAAIARNLQPSEYVLEKFNKYLSETFNDLKINVEKDRIVTEDWYKKNSGLLQIQHLIIKSAYELLISNSLIRLKECDNCGWLFLDKSKNKSRRWCNMQTCGSMEKAKKYYRSKKNMSVDRKSTGD